MLYICPECYSWSMSIGLAEALAESMNAKIELPCPDCETPMLRFKPGSKVKLSQEQEQIRPRCTRKPPYHT